MNDLYRTIESKAEGQFREKGSRFIAIAYPVSNEEVKLENRNKKYNDARHHCFAWRLGAEHERYRVNDDGEPSGSAGKPIFGQIQSRGLTEILVVVVRYFGGTLLGVGGLIQAYRSATAQALENTVIIEKKVEEFLHLEFDYASMNAVMKMIKEFDLQFEDKKFDLECSLTLRVWIRDARAVQDRISKIPGCSLS